MITTTGNRRLKKIRIMDMANILQNDSKPDNTRRRYDRVALFYDFMEAIIERSRFAAWRSQLVARIQGDTILEAGVGTGKNLPYYPPHIRVVAVDFSSRMLERAQKRVQRMGRNADLIEMDVERLAFPDHCFDTVLATFVFCSVPNPVNGLRELHRVCRPDGRLLLLEHMRPERCWLGWLFDRFNPIIVRSVGANINRRTMENIRQAGWRVEKETFLFSDIVRLIEATP